MKQMTPKNLCKWTLTMAMAVIFCAFCVMMAAQSVSGTCGDQVKWSLENGVLTISGSGPMEDYGYDTAPWFAQRGDIKKIVIESGVTSVGNFAFNGCVDLTEVVIPEGVTDIGNSAFNECISLRKIPLPESVTVIDGWAFAYCRALEHISFGSNVKSIGEGVLGFNKALSSITVAGGNTAYQAINNCLIETASGKLLACCRTSILPDDGSVKIIGENVFGGQTGLSSIVIPEGVVSIGANAFRNCTYLTSVTLPKSLMSIENALSGCEKIATVTVAEGNPYFRSENNCLIRQQDNSLVFRANNGVIPEGVKAGGMWDAAARWSLTDGVLTVWASSHGYVGDNAWYDMNVHGLIRKAVLEDGVGRIPGMFFANCENLTEVVIPDSVIVIYVNAFQNCSSLTEITLGTGVRNIENGAFNNCTALKRVIAPADSSFFRNEGNRLVEISTGKTVFEPLPLPASQTPVVSQSVSVSQPAADSQPETVSQNTSSEPSAGKISWSVENGVLTVWGSGPIPDYDTQEPPWSAHRLEIKKVIIEDGITVIGKRAFAEISVATEVSIANTVTTIKQSAFYWCRSLTEIVIPDSVTDIHQGAFNACYDLRSVVIGAGLRSSLFTIFPLKVKNITVHPDNKVYRSENNCIIWREDDLLCFRADDAVVPDGVTIGYSNDNGSWDLQDGTLTVSVQGSTQKLGLSWEAVNLDEVIYKVVLKEGVTAVDSRNFRDCKNLTEVILPDSLTEIGSHAFYYCSSLREVTIPDSVTVIGDAAFSLCEMLQRVTIGAGVEEIAANAFYDCNALKEIVVHPDNKIYHVENGCLFKTATREIVATTVDAQLPSGAALEGTSGFVKWNISDGVLTISGSGPMQDYYSANDAPWSKQRKNIIKAVVEDGVSSIGVNAFNHFVNMTELVIGADVTKIEKSAFTNCYALSKITVDENNKVYRDEDNCLIVRHSGQVLVVGADTEPPSAGGGYCGGKVAWSLENGILTISGSGDMYGYGFSNSPWYLMREKIYSVVVENGVTNVGGGSFSGCVNLKSVRLADSVEEIETYVFNNCTRLESIHISEGIVKIWHGAFTNCSSLTEIVLPDSLQVLYPYVFEGCVQLSQMTVPDTVTEIGEGLFKDCFNLKKLNIGAGVAKIDKTAFLGCDKLNKVTVEPDNEIYLSEGNCVLERTDNRLVFSAQGAVMPKSVRLEGSYGTDFTWTLQNGVLTISGTGTLQKSEQQEAPWQEWKTLVSKVVLEEGVTRIGTHSFAEYPALKEVVFPRSLTELEDFAFWRCDALTEVTFKGTYSRWKTIDVGKNTPIEQADVFGVISAHIWLVAVVVLVPAAVIICLKRRKD